MATIAEQKLQQAAEYLRQENIDLWLIFASEESDPAVSLLTGLKTVGKTFFLLTKEGMRYALCTTIDSLESKNSGLFDEVLTYPQEPAEKLNELVDRINPNRIILNYSEEDNLCDGLTTGRYRYLARILSRYADRFESSETILQKIRAHKTSEELAAIRKAVEITEEIYQSVFDRLRPGLTEYEIGQMFVDGMTKHGVVAAASKDLAMPIVMKEKIAHRDPGSAVLEPGDFLIMDFGVDYMGYCSDIARTAYFLKPGETDAPERFRYIFDSQQAAVDAAFAMLKPGVHGWEVDAAARQTLLDAGLPEITHATGHQVGRQEHDGGTMLAPKWPRYGKGPYGIVEKDMVVTLEPTVLQSDGDYSCLCEDDVLVTENGAEFISHRQKHLILVHW